MNGIEAAVASHSARVAIPGFCGLCKSRCGSLMVVEDGRLVAQEPNPEHPTGTAQCIKGRAAPEMVYDPQRLLHPVMRTRPKGDADPGWRELSWDEALARTAAALARIRDASGAESVAFGIATPSGTPIADDLRWIERFANAFGSPNVVSGAEICNWHKDFTHVYTFGRGIATPDFEHTSCIVLWGHNPGATWLNNASAIAAAKARGARIVVIDPRKSGFAVDADLWLRVRPGADGALALGISRAMIVNGWFDATFVREFTNAPLLVRSDTGRFLRAGDLAVLPVGADPDDLLARTASGEVVAYHKAARRYAVASEDIALTGEDAQTLADGGVVSCKTVFSLFASACEPYTPERVAEICWIDAAQVVEAARLFHAAAPAVSYYCWAGVCQHTNATQTDRAIATMMALTGSFDAKGGNVAFPPLPVNDVSGKEFLTTAQRAKCIGLERSRLGPARHAWIGSDALYDAILERRPYPIRALVGFGRNFLLNHADAERGAKALAALEFYVHADVTLTPTASFADIVLPIGTPWERESLRTGFEGSLAAEQWVQLRQAAIAPLGESRSDAEVVFELAKRMGLGEHFWDGDIQAGLEHILDPLDICLDDLRRNPNGIALPTVARYRKHVQDGFKTETGKIELYSEVFLANGVSPLPTFVEPALSPLGSGYGDYPLVLTTAKTPNYRHSQDRQVPSLRRRVPEPEVHLHPGAAQVRDIREGDWVRVRSPHGRIRMRARFDDNLDPRVAWIEYGWWQQNGQLGLDGYDALADRGSNFSRLVSDRNVDPVSGSQSLRSVLCEIEPEAECACKAWRGWRRFRIVEAVAEARDIVSFHLAPEDGRPLPPFEGGQHVVLRMGPEGSKWIRCYSLSSAPSTDYYRITVKLVRPAASAVGRMSGFLHAAAVPGDIVELMAPKGDFRTPAHCGNGALPIVMIAGGIGITPLLSMLYQLRRDGREDRVDLFYSVRSGDEHAFAAEIRDLQEALRGLRVTTFYTRPRESDRQPGNFDVAGRISDRHIAQAARMADAKFYVCGPAAMIEAVTDGLARAGVDESRIFLEAFGPSSRQAAATSASPQPVTFARSGRSVVWRPGSLSLLELAEASGIKAGSGCRVGQCEACAAKLIAGKVAHPASNMRSSDICLLCTAIPLTPLVIDV